MGRDPLRDVAEVVRVASADGPVEIGPIAAAELQQLFVLFSGIVAAREGYPHAPPLTWSQFEETWVRPVSMVVVARLGGVLAGAYYLKPNSPGRGAHIANGGYLVAGAHRRRGLGRLLVADSVERAPLAGFDAVQFNLVFASNPARQLYEELGWREIGRVPEAVGGEDAIIYWRRVGPGSPPLPEPAGQAAARSATPAGRG